MRFIWERIFQRQHLLMTKIMIPLFKHSIDRYNSNILIIIAIIHNIYTESELYNLPYGKIKVGFLKWNFKSKKWVNGKIVIISQEIL